MAMMPPPRMPMKSEMIVRIGAITHAGNHARHHQLANRIGAERPQRVDLIGDDHRAELGGDARSDAAGEHQRRQHRPELFHHRGADEPADDRPRAELVERQAALQREHGAGEDAGQQHDRERSDADGLELLDDVVEIERAAERVARGGPAELDVFLNLEQPLTSASCRTDSAHQLRVDLAPASPSSRPFNVLILSRSVAARSKSRLAAAWRIWACNSSMRDSSSSGLR